MKSKPKRTYNIDDGTSGIVLCLFGTLTIVYPFWRFRPKSRSFGLQTGKRWFELQLGLFGVLHEHL